MLETKSRVIGQMIVCHGCCCGATLKDRPAVPADWLKDEWRKARPFEAISTHGQWMCGSL